MHTVCTSYKLFGLISKDLPILFVVAQTIINCPPKQLDEKILAILLLVGCYEFSSACRLI